MLRSLPYSGLSSKRLEDQQQGQQQQVKAKELGGHNLPQFEQVKSPLWSSMNRRERIAWFLVGLQSVWLLHSRMSWSTMSLSTLSSSLRRTGRLIVGEWRTWHGGTPRDERLGSCWCSVDNYKSGEDWPQGEDRQYCMCTPSIAIDVVLQIEDSNDIWLVRRGDTNQLATMGGFVDVGESPAHAVQRELSEETGMTIASPETSLQLLGIYGDPNRDNRRHTLSAVYVATISADQTPHARDDVKDVIRVPLNDVGVKHLNFFADHLTILRDYQTFRKNQQQQQQATGRDDDDNEKGKKPVGELAYDRNLCYA